MGKITISETASGPREVELGGSEGKRSEVNESASLPVPIEHYVSIAAKVESHKISVDGEMKSTKSEKPVKQPSKSPKISKFANNSNKPAEKKVEKKASSEKPKPEKVKAIAPREVLALPAGTPVVAVADEQKKKSSEIKVTDKSADINKNAAANKDVDTKKEDKKSKEAKSGTPVTILAVDGVVKTTVNSANNAKPKVDTDVNARGDLSARAPKVKAHVDEEERVGSGEPRFSKPKSALIGVAVAMIVMVIGGVIISIMGRSERAMCLVQFESNGGSKIEDKEIVCGDYISRPGDPTKEGFSFQNWIYGGSPFDFANTKIDENTILVAKWIADGDTEIVLVKFDTNGGSKVEDIEAAKGSIIHAPVAPTKSGYIFDGWTLNGEDFDFSKPITSEITLKAQWKKAPTQSSSQTTTTRPGSTQQPVDDKPGDISSGDDQKKIDSLRPEMSAYSGEAGSSKSVWMDVINADDADFDLMVSSSSNRVVSCSANGLNSLRISCTLKEAGDATITVEDKISGLKTSFTITVTAKVVEPEPPVESESPVETEKYTVRFDGGDAVQVEKGQTVSRPTDPEREGYTFEDWYDGDELYNFDTPVNGDVNLTAKWIENTTPSGPGEGEGSQTES